LFSYKVRVDYLLKAETGKVSRLFFSKVTQQRLLLDARLFSCFPPSIDHRPSTIDYRPSTIDHRPLADTDTDSIHYLIVDYRLWSIIKMKNSCFSQSQFLFYPFWNCITCIGLRRCFRFLQITNPHAYGDTISHFDLPPPPPPPPPLQRRRRRSPPPSVVALTIDDGLSRGGLSTSMADDVFDLLDKYNAHATFFVCTDYIKDQQESVRTLFQRGHEVGNHMQADRLWYYQKLEPHEFQSQLQDANRILDDLEALYGGGTTGTTTTTTKTRWFRAPQGIMTSSMSQVLQQDPTIKHVLGDCYCDDWSFAEDVDHLFTIKNNGGWITDETLCTTKQIARREAVMKKVAKLMLAQAKVGSVAILHMPERGFRQGGLLALEYFLEGIQKKGWSCVNLTEMQLCCQHEEKIARVEGEDDFLNNPM